MILINFSCFRKVSLSLTLRHVSTSTKCDMLTAEMELDCSHWSAGHRNLCEDVLQFISIECVPCVCVLWSAHVFYDKPVLQ